MFEYTIEVLNTLIWYPQDCSEKQTKHNKKLDKKMKELEFAIKVLQELGKDDIKSRLLNILQENFMFNSYGEFNEIETKQYKNCINSILKELGIEDKVYNI